MIRLIALLLSSYAKTIVIFSYHKQQYIDTEGKYTDVKPTDLNYAPNTGKEGNSYFEITNKFNAALTSAESGLIWTRSQDYCARWIYLPKDGNLGLLQNKKMCMYADDEGVVPKKCPVTEEVEAAFLFRIDIEKINGIGNCPGTITDDKPIAKDKKQEVDSPKIKNTKNEDNKKEDTPETPATKEKAAKDAESEEENTKSKVPVKISKDEESEDENIKEEVPKKNSKDRKRSKPKKKKKSKQKTHIKDEESVEGSSEEEVPEKKKKQSRQEVNAEDNPKSSDPNPDNKRDKNDKKTNVFVVNLGDIDTLGNDLVGKSANPAALPTPITPPAALAAPITPTILPAPAIPPAALPTPITPELPATKPPGAPITPDIPGSPIKPELPATKPPGAPITPDIPGSPIKPELPATKPPGAPITPDMPGSPIKPELPATNPPGAPITPAALPAPESPLTKPPGAPITPAALPAPESPLTKPPGAPITSEKSEAEKKAEDASKRATNISKTVSPVFDLFNTLKNNILGSNEIKKQMQNNYTNDDGSAENGAINSSN